MLSFLKNKYSDFETKTKKFCYFCDVSDTINLIDMKKYILLSAIALALASCAQAPKEAEPSALDTIFARKSVRQWTAQPVEAEKLETLVKAAMAAPSGMNLQPWHFIVVTDEATRNTLGGMYASAPAVIVVCGETTMSRKDRETGEEIQMENGNWTADCAAATENLLLAAEALGLGAVWTACYPYEDRINPVKAALEIPENVCPYCVVPVGYPAGDDQPKDKWKPEKVHQNRW